MPERRLKIIHSESSCGWGGQELRILSESAGMIARGHDVGIVGAVHAPLYAEAQARNIPVWPLPIERKRISAVVAFARWLNDHPCDILNTHSSTDSWLAALACRLISRRPALVRTRHVSVPIRSTFATRWLYRQPRRIVTTGEALRDQITALGIPGDRVRSIPTGQDTQKFSPGFRDAAREQLGIAVDRYVVSIVATLRSWKGHRYLIDAFARIAAPNMQLLIVGDGPQRTALAQQARSHACSAQIVFVGQQPDVAPYLQASDLFVLPSYAHEGVPQSLIQAMLCGLPIITTPVGAIGEAVTEGVSALMVAPHDVDRLADAIRAMINDPGRALSLGAQARAQALNTFSVERMLDAMEQVFHDAVAG